VGRHLLGVARACRSQLHIGCSPQLLGYPRPLLTTMAEDRPLSTANSESVTPPHSSLAFDSAPLEPPRASFFSGTGTSIGESASHHSAAPSATGPEFDKESFTQAQSATLLPAGKDSEGPPSQGAPRTRPLYRRPLWLAIAFGTLAALIFAIILPVYFTVIHKSGQSNKLSNNPGTSSGNKPSPTGNPESPSGATSGGNGSTIISGNTSFVYLNPFGGYCEFLLTSNYLPIWTPDGRRVITRLARESLLRVCVCSRFVLALWTLGGAFLGRCLTRRDIVGSPPFINFIIYFIS